MKVIKENDPAPFFGVNPFCQLFFFIVSTNHIFGTVLVQWNSLKNLSFFGHFVIHPYAKCSKMAILFTL